MLNWVSERFLHCFTDVRAWWIMKTQLILMGVENDARIITQLARFYRLGCNDCSCDLPIDGKGRA
ncbi:hypothetical protein METHB2_450012 [Candidatus Methylobacter favarea]|uniref:Uncharacterized protein n=1 Tax=Candidatus Methylobacter favarea TaxID=2707345 RepID=A0A8S0Y6K8_9GAMM|nr:hypothetical protein METHB2_450012 [Candidatus Methylobacter favarea]